MQSSTQALARFGAQALAELDLQVLIADAVTILARTLDVQYSGFLELLPDGQTLLLQAGVGWKDGYVGRLTVPIGPGSQEAYTLEHPETVRVDELRNERRFVASPLYLEHGLVSGVTVAVRGAEGIYGILGAHSTHQRVFGGEAVAFVDGIAAVLALAAERHRSQRLAGASEERLRVAVE